MSKQAVLLDAGGVLLDETNLEEAFCKSIVDALHLCEYDYTADQYWRDYKQGMLCFCPKSTHYVMWKVTGGNIEEFNRVIGVFREVFAQPRLVLMPGIDAQLQTLANKFALVLAGQYGSEIYDLLDKHDLSGLFANRYSQDNFALTKPDPRYFLQLADRAGISPADCIMVGDRIDKDIVPAKMAGMKTVLVKSSIYKIQQPRIPDECPDATIESVNELAEAIENLR
ncbi:MAG: HAD-IA family hydrolase [Candidatus Zixiibacteriota bacterium]